MIVVAIDLIRERFSEADPNREYPIAACLSKTNISKKKKKKNNLQLIEKKLTISKLKILNP